MQPQRDTANNKTKASSREPHPKKKSAPLRSKSTTPKPKTNHQHKSNPKSHSSGSVIPRITVDSADEEPGLFSPSGVEEPVQDSNLHAEAGLFSPFGLFSPSGVEEPVQDPNSHAEASLDEEHGLFSPFGLFSPSGVEEPVQDPNSHVEAGLDEEHGLFSPFGLFSPSDVEEPVQDSNSHVEAGLDEEHGLFSPFGLFSPSDIEEPVQDPTRRGNQPQRVKKDRPPRMGPVAQQRPPPTKHTKSPSPKDKSSLHHVPLDETPRKKVSISGWSSEYLFEDPDSIRKSTISARIKFIDDYATKVTNSTSHLSIPDRKRVMYRLDDVFSKHMDIMRKLIRPKTTSALPQPKRKLDGNSEKADNGARDGNHSKRQKF